jgi:hypothetical protein
MDGNERRQLGRLLARWCATVSYQKSLRQRGALRHGLDGQQVEPVSREHQARALQEIYRLRVKRERRDAARERAARAPTCRANAALPRLGLGRRTP